MVKTAIQLYTLRNIDLPFAELLEAVAAVGFDGVEYAYRVTQEDPEAVSDVLAETGLESAGAHVAIDELENNLEETVQFYDTLGCENLVVPWLDEKFFATKEGIATATERLESIDSELAERDRTLHYHNHAHEYVDCDGRPGFLEFIDTTDIGLELDLGFIEVADDDPVERLRAVGDRCRLAHLKDFDTAAGESVPVGRGDLDIESCASTFSEIGGEWLIYEYEGEDALESLEEVASTMAELV